MKCDDQVKDFEDFMVNQDEKNVNKQFDNIEKSVKELSYYGFEKKDFRRLLNIVFEKTGVQK